MGEKGPPHPNDPGTSSTLDSYSPSFPVPGTELWHPVSPHLPSLAHRKDS